jgi:hypothetical protein
MSRQPMPAQRCAPEPGVDDPSHYPEKLMATQYSTNLPDSTDTRARLVFTTTETKPSFKTSELIAYVVAVIGVLVASAVTDRSDFGAQEAWFYVTLLTIGYMVSRGLAKAGSYEKEHHTAHDSGQ